MSWSAMSKPAPRSRSTAWPSSPALKAGTQLTTRLRHRAHKRQRRSGRPTPGVPRGGQAASHGTGIRRVLRVAPARPWRKGPAQPFYFYPADGQPLVLAGLWDTWYDAERRPLRTCAIVTTTANATMAPVHHRMPVVLSRRPGTNGLARDRWDRAGSTRSSSPRQRASSCATGWVPPSTAPATMALSSSLP
jgi:hypothetical protein